MVFWNKELLFCDINPTCYAISVKKENLKRHLQDLKRKENFATDFQKEKLTYVVSERSSNMIKRAEGVDLASQFNKAKNIELACQKLNGLVIKPGEVFSFWKLVGKISEKKGYKAGRVIERNKLIEENRELKNRLANVSLWDLSPEAAEEAGHAFAKDLLGR